MRVSQHRHRLLQAAHNPSSLAQPKQACSDHPGRQGPSPDSLSARPARPCHTDPQACRAPSPPLTSVVIMQV